MKVRLPVLRSTLVVVVLLSMLVSALPQPAQAATCEAYHYVKAGETTVTIAQTYGIKWGLIAKANKLEYPYKLKVGQRLCIPPADAEVEDEDATKFKLSITASQTSVTITLSGLSVKKAGFNVKARNALTWIGGWERLGHFKAKEKKTTKVVYSIPKVLKDDLYLQICLKNVTTDELTCKTIFHP